ncbi:ABC transporter permease [Paenibacillus tritici]|uniref:ABC transporter permease n=1 Tax=Paenibacillus tritici TaxID=1873425 RepID=UPI001BA70CDB|nr:ABC transporter permease [Paenibacillus tritici]QUL53752.1 ABC transporter permease [Paenibacillus tritici]
MSISYKRVRAIFVKDYKEFSRNYALSIMLIFPIILALLFRRAGTTLPGASGFLFNSSFVLLTCFAQACLIAEEKERSTLRSLMMTPATTMDVLLGKSSLVFVMSAVVIAISSLLFGYEPVNAGAFVTGIVLSIILYTAAGTICGLFSKTLLEASLSILPVAFIFMGAPWGAVLAKDYPVFQVLDYMPSSQLVHLLSISGTGYTTADLTQPLLIILAWTVGLTIVSVVLYQKRLKDE